MGNPNSKFEAIIGYKTHFQCWWCKGENIFNEGEIKYAPIMSTLVCKIHIIQTSFKNYEVTVDHIPGDHFLWKWSFWGVSLPICAALLISVKNFRVLAFSWSDQQIIVSFGFPSGL